jgi:spermidine synthase
VRLTRRSERGAPAPYPIATERVVAEVRPDRERPGGRLLLMDGVEAAHVDVDDPTHLEFEYLRHLVRLIDIAHPRRLPLRALHLGGGPCTLARYLAATRREVHSIVLEHDPGVIEVARRWMELRISPSLEVRIGDARALLGGVPAGWAELMVVDVFDGIQVPHHVTTLEFLDESRQRLRPGGLHVVNLIDIAPLGLAAALAATLLARFATVALMTSRRVLEEGASGNLVLAAADRQLDLDLLTRLVPRDPSGWRVVRGRALQRLAGGAPILRDDEAPTHALATLAPLWGRTGSRRAAEAAIAPTRGR